MSDAVEELTGFDTVVVLTRAEHEPPIRAGLRPAELSIYVGDDPVFHFDREGRLRRAFVDDHHFRRAGDGALRESWWRDRARGWREYEKRAADTRADSLFRQAHAAVVQTRALLREQHPEAPAPLHAALDKAAGWDAERLRAERQRFREVYRPITILPPDQYLALVLQMTEGCSWNRCTFCDLYKDIPFTLKPLDEFRRHIEAVKALWGEALRTRRTIFVGQANAMLVDPTRLHPYLDLIAEHFTIAPPDLAGRELREWQRAAPGRRFAGLFAFCDVFTQHKSPAQWHELRQRGLRRVYVGAETGDDQLLVLLNKPASAAQTTAAVRDMKAGGMNVGLIFLVGAGGRPFRERHRHSSVRLVEALVADGTLERTDIIYLSPFVQQPHGDYAQMLQDQHIDVLSDQEIEEEAQSLASLLRSLGPDAPRVAAYKLERFLY